MNSPETASDLGFSAVETMGLEPTTPCLQSRCSSQLSYVPEGAQRTARDCGSVRNRATASTMMR